MFSTKHQNDTPMFIILRETNIRALTTDFRQTFRKAGACAFYSDGALLLGCSAFVYQRCRKFVPRWLPAFSRWPHDTAWMGTWFHAAALFSRSSDVVCRSHVSVSWFVSPVNQRTRKNDHRLEQLPHLRR